ncbi:hypothetical protein NHX12_002824 [Muraenolepis orangiensis]|uniref:Coiled-coil domain-containing protein 77 n=1 Tax=Muraenolepis orangiensis TaxID=630683 RepID=A0A9Q0E1J6_9TELE|nr:hypothetical protein NHX12_002824 [Muraenolepis orangiensis]
MQSPVRNAASHRSGPLTPGQDEDSPLPPLGERLAHLRPSRELLEFYRQKISQFESEREGLLQTLEKYRGMTEEQHKLQWEVRQGEREVAELQKALSDMQVYLFQEREQSLRLYAENDRLKIRELEDRRKIQHLLSLVTPGVTIPQKKPETGFDDNLNLRPTKMRPGSDGSRRTRPADEGHGENVEQYRTDNQTLLLQVEALQAQMEEQARLAKEQVESLLDDRRIQLEEAQGQHGRDEQRVEDLTDKLQRTQNMLYESTRDVLMLKFEIQAHEVSWMAEKDRLLRDLDDSQVRLRKARSGMDDRATAAGSLRGSGTTPLLSRKAEPRAEQSHREERKGMQEDLKQARRLAEMYREQCITLETELSQIREEGDVGREIFKERSDKIAKRLQLMTQRYEALEKRRAMEAEGFKVDLRLLRRKLKDVEQQLMKVTLSVGPNQDLAILHEVKQSNARTRKVQGEIMALKAKIYGLENDLRHC